VITEERGLDERATERFDADAHLQRLLRPEEPWFKSTIQNIKEYFNPPKLPPLEVTSKPAEVQDIWKTYDIAPKRSGLISALSTVGIHVLTIALLFLIFKTTPAARILKKYTGTGLRQALHARRCP
jgi:hypothetical protein